MWDPREKRKRIAGSVVVGEGFSAETERAEVSRTGLIKAEIERMAPAATRDEAVPVIWAA